MIEDAGWFWGHADQRHLIAHEYLIANYVCALTTLIYHHANPYGIFALDLKKHLPFKVGCVEAAAVILLKQRVAQKQALFRVF